MNKKIKIVIGYPPIESKKGVPLLSQNRQFQYFNSPTYIYPMVPAYAATMLKKNGYRVYWLDGIAEKQTYDDWVKQLTKIKPDYLLIETKTPVIKIHWQMINQLKIKNLKLKIILVGDHVTYLPLESFENSQVDYVITGGDYDFVLVNLLNHIYKGEKLEGGVYWRKNDEALGGVSVRVPDSAEILGPRQNLSQIYNSGPASLKHDLNSLPFIDRDLTKWKLYAYENGNYKYTPGTYMYSGRDCWWNRCTFCIWDQLLYPLGSYRSFSPERLFAEVKYVVDKYHVKEIFDDAGTMFAGNKMKRFCQLMINSGYNKKVVFGCNMRFNAINQDLYYLMKKANFRFILYGMESANQKTLDKIQKGIKVKEIIEGGRMAAKAGLEPHATIMLGYPWESYKDAKKTIKLAKYCFQKGYFNTIQATLVIPYPGSKLWKECKEKGWLLTENYERYDMREPVMKIPFAKEKIYELEQELYSAFMTPQYIFRKIVSIRSFHDFKYLFYMAWKLLAHLLDFDPNQTRVNFLSFKFWKNASKKLLKHFFGYK
ncbi:B12-binding domain-containing radical SAM protein [Candidatus Roizmanbacteria bacterium CG02_land_8_20_14_3_00_36_15]|uniref:B12-binding domain-containing radical SAM protein n=2 Tax=Candidatus Roizmaniibacteriota TaxID=1752723 RepID=A0A2M8KMM3_9BACT|nr:MAG: B12-binding domain-containing radical SAM protein [Candidatus Roizmanbacteria bacterium CG03_land_8_20_14_0_80_36_21]PIV37801.1 MAG: B12-binding domain-containing radical SAM protein [Candidatus Roizmanbacteria bacterium CG02_land_8_20_14_3_00_36_15]PJA52598.1 MAG: B12-binding domain-containing radical SAM protein [Candidatus Roizmanbacteria bacterium CG_4_9_14_3_um_filter_36_11]PJC82264.1 MAG: B12-binding domain-containing radical SAM protein [Candidatus Roizmanbacteria bacterium CG_4_8